jgi:hypothetical protein
MTTGRAVRRGRGLAWTLFWVTSALGLGATVVLVLAAGHPSGVAPALIFGLCVVGVAAAVMAADEPVPPVQGRHTHPAVHAGGDAGGSSGSGDCGGGGDGC